MNYNIKTTGLELSDEIRTYIEKRLVHVDTLLKDDTTAHTDVEIQQTQKEEHEKISGRIYLTIRRHGVSSRIIWRIVACSNRLIDRGFNA